jgi:hypothetical protein
MAIGLACFCLLALAAIGSPGTATAAECPNEAIRIAQGATDLPDCRAYEQVSPADSTGGVAGLDSSNKMLFGAMRADGSAAAFGSSSAIGDSERGALRTFNLAHRTPSGWTSFGMLTTTEPSVPIDLSMAPAWPTPSSDMTRMMFITSRSLGPPNPIPTGGSVYLSAPEGKGPPVWLSRWTFPGTQPKGSGMPLGGTADMSSGYFRYSTPLTSLAGDESRTSGFGLYHFEGQTISPAGVLPSGVVSPSGALPAGVGNKTGTNGSQSILSEMTHNQVSADGTKLFFVSPAEGTEPKQLYVEEGDKPGRLISHDLAGNPAVDGINTLEGQTGQFAVDTFAAATPDGSRVVFRSEAALTEDAPAAGIKAYRAQITPSAITLQYLPQVAGKVMAIDGDASAILFSAPGSTAGETSYYVWDESHPSAPYTVVPDLASSSGPQMIEPLFSEDGEVLVFNSGAEVEPGITPRPEVAYTQVYRWTRQSGTTKCISCLSAGSPARFGSRLTSLDGLPTDNAAFPSGALADMFNQSTVATNRKMSSDGSRVFFDTSDPLDPSQDVNGNRDVYMWENGKDYLLTSGRGQYPSFIIDNSASGGDVLMATSDGLVPSDTNQTYDVYDVRVDGGFAEPTPEGCEGAACQASRAAPAASSPASRSVSGAGNAHQVRLGGVKVAQVGKPGRTARVRVNLPAAGHLKLGGRLLKGKSRSVKAKGAVKLGLALTKAGKRKLAAQGHLRTRVTATFRDAEGQTKKSSVTLRFKQGGHR